jgi:hypothetical protein
VEPTQLVLVLRHSYRLWGKWPEMESYGGTLDEERESRLYVLS